MAHQSWKLRFAHLCFLGVLGVGCCPPAAIYVETTIHSDGSCDRMIWQPRDKFLPEQALKPEWNGSTLSAAEADELIQAIENHHRYENAIQEESKRIEERLQGDKQLNKRIKRDVLQMVGLYSFRFLLSGGAPEFEFAMRIPGDLIETNGTGTKNGRTRWKFTGDQLFPNGYEMKARSIEIDRDAQKKVLGRVAFDDETKAMQFMEVVGREGPLLEAVRNFRQTGDRHAAQSGEDSDLR